MVLDWTRKVHQLEYAHCYESIIYAYSHTILSVITLIITTLVASSYQFPQIDKAEYDKLFFLWKQDYFVSIFSTIAAIFTAVITFVRPSEKAEEHRRLGLDYEKIRHDFEKIVTYSYTDWQLEIEADKIKAKWDNLQTKYVTPFNYNRARNKVKNFGYPSPMSFIQPIDICECTENKS